MLLKGINAKKDEEGRKAKKKGRKERKRRKEKGREYIRLEDKRAINLQDTNCKSE